VVVAFNLVTGLVAVIGASFGSRTPVMLPLVIVPVVQAVVLWWRRSRPVTVLLIVLFMEVARIFTSNAHEASGVGLAFAIYAVSVYDRSRVRLFVAAAAIAVILAAVAFLLLGNFETSRVFIPAGALSLVAWVIGDYVRSRRQFFTELVARHKQEREQAAEEERLRIARELHDVVAHNVSVMAIQAGAARVAGNSSPETLESIEKSARDTLSELNKMLGVLRKSPGTPELAPQPSLSDVDALLRPARETGLDTTLKVSGTPRPLPAAVDLSAYRIVQEAITNVLKHANASRVEVLIDYEPEGVALTISDNGTGPGEATGTGHGLIGMRERVELFGGKMATDSSPLGGFTVHARLPVNT
jgi:signal transduction histidine kinase